MSYTDAKTISPPRPRFQRSIVLQQTVVSSTKEFASLRDEWSGLVGQARATVFQSFEWVFLWWKHFGNSEGHQLHIIILRDSGRTVAILPFFLKEFRVFNQLILRQLRLMGCGITDSVWRGLKLDYGPSDYLDVIVHPDYRKEVIEFLVEYLSDPLRNFDEAELLNIPEFSLILDAVRATDRDHRTRVIMQKADICPQLQIPHSVEEYVLSRRPRVRRRFLQTVKASGKLYELRSVQTEADIETFLSNLVNLHQRHWNQLGYPGLFADHRFLSFQRELAQMFLANGWLWFKSAHANGECVASHLAFIFNDVLYVYLSGFDKDSIVARRRPGLALILSMIQDSIDRRVHTMDFLRGDESYKYDFTETAIQNWNIWLVHERALGRPRIRLFYLLADLRQLLLLMCTELRLLRIHFREHGIARFLQRYILFRYERLTARRSRATTDTVQELHDDQD